MSYLVLARKWRPSKFIDVVGQSHITKTLQNAIEQNRIPHALLFIGSRGVGKTSCARILAKALNCLSANHAVPNPCDQCDNCSSITKGSNVDVIEIDGASNNGVEQIREIRDSARFAPSQCRYKVYIIDEVHMLSVGAFNSLLKILEEPPQHVIFVFATTEAHKIPETIISRCQRFDFKRISEGDIVGALLRIADAEKVNVEKAALEHIAREAQGGMRDSLSLLDQMISFCGNQVTEAETRRILGLTPRQTLKGILEGFFTQNPVQVLTLIDEQIEAGVDVQRLMTEFLKFLRDMMILKIAPQPQKILTLPPSEIDEMRKGTENFDPNQIHRFFNILSKQTDEILKSPYPRLVFEMACLQLCHQGATSSINEVLNQLLKLEKNIGQGNVGGSSPVGFNVAQVYASTFDAHKPVPYQPLKQTPNPPNPTHPNPTPQVPQPIQTQAKIIEKNIDQPIEQPKVQDVYQSKKVNQKRKCDIGYYEKMELIYQQISAEDGLFAIDVKSQLKLLEYQDQILHIAYHQKIEERLNQRMELFKKCFEQVFLDVKFQFKRVNEQDEDWQFQSLTEYLDEKRLAIETEKVNLSLQSDFIKKLKSAFNLQLLNAYLKG
jgi:DNA polymerase-3 subunit gamma/tau